MGDTLLIHTRASGAAGHGHAVRCLTLAAEAARRGMIVRFAAPDPETTAVLAEYGAPAEAFAAGGNARFIIRDLPGGSDASEVAAEITGGARVLLLDDPGAARCVAHVVVDAMMTRDRAAAHAHAGGVVYLYGLEFTPLRAEVLDHSAAGRPGRATSQRLVIALGGGFDPALPGRLVEGLVAAGFIGRCELLLPPSDATQALAHSLQQRFGVTPHVGVQAVGAVLARADLVITKLGITQLEAFAVGVGVLLVEPSHAHLEVQSSLAAQYGDWPAVETGLIDDGAEEQLVRQALALLRQPEVLRRMGERARALVDGRGAARVIDALLAA